MKNSSDNSDKIVPYLCQIFIKTAGKTGKTTKKPRKQFWMRIDQFQYPQRVIKSGVKKIRRGLY